MKSISKRLLAASLLSGVAFSPLANAGLLDRIKDKARDATESIQDVRGDVEDNVDAVTSVDDVAAAEVRAAENEMNAAGQQVNGQVAAIGTADERLAATAEAEALTAVSANETVQDIAEAERQVADIENTPERMQAGVERQAEQAVRGSAVGRTATEAEMLAAQAEAMPEQVERNAVRQADSALGVSATQRELAAAERDVDETGRALEDLANEFD